MSLILVGQVESLEKGRLESKNLKYIYATFQLAEASDTSPPSLSCGFIFCLSLNFSQFFLYVLQPNIPVRNA